MVKVMNLFWAALVYVGGTAALYNSKFGSSTQTSHLQVSHLSRVSGKIGIPERLKRSRSRLPEDIPGKSAL